MIKMTSTLFSTCLLSLALSQTATALTPAPITTPFPIDPQTSGCSVDQTTFNSWFGGTAPTKGAPANAADSIGFPTNNTKCDFYKWSSQMFLWLASPSGQSYVFDSVEFFDVSPKDASGERTLLPNTPGSTKNTFSIRTTKNDEIIGETGQAGGNGVLISQKDSIVYYGIHVNDVYAYFLSDQKNNNKPLTDFPNTATQLEEVVSYAESQGVTLPDANALTMELKTSWVDATTISDTTKYLTITAEVPNYKKTSDTIWSIDGTTTKELAMVGMHIVGTVKDHPEMVWATVEHLDNTFDTAYFYINNKGEKTLVPRPASGSWTFASNSTSGIQWNVERSRVYTEPSASFPACKTATCELGDIVGFMDNTIGSSMVVRMNPWGTAVSSNNATSDPENNSELISLNNDVMGFLADGDVRKHYFVSGAVWTRNGNIPTYNAGGPSFVQVGSLSLANSTMETYHQETASSASTADAGCFMCHSISGTQAKNKQGVAVSHIFSEIKAIPKKN